jgi:hypothetical protein
MKRGRLGGLALLGMLTLAVSALSQSRDDLRLTTSTWRSNSASRESVYVVARATNTGTHDLLIDGGLRFWVEYAPSARSDSIMAARTASLLKARGNTHLRCSAATRFPNTRNIQSQPNPSGLVLKPGEVLTDTFAFAPPRASFEDWSGALVVKCSLCIETGRKEKPYDVYAPEDVWVSIPVP